MNRATWSASPRAYAQKFRMGRGSLLMVQADVCKPDVGFFFFPESLLTHSIATEAVQHRIFIPIDFTQSQFKQTKTMVVQVENKVAGKVDCPVASTQLVS